MIQLKEYQNRAINDEENGMLSKAMSVLRSPDMPEDIDHIPLILLRSITGSGKTVIAAAFIDELLDSTYRNPDREMAVIWLSKGNARLHMQSCEKIRDAIEDADIHIYGLEDSTDFNAEQFYDKDVYVINWEKLNNIRSDKLSSNLFLDTEQPNLTRALRNTRQHTDMDFIFIIDEFHTNYNTDSYRKIVELFQPRMIVGMTATPLEKQISQVARTNGRYVEIRVSDVQKEEMVKKGILFNTSKGVTIPSTYATREEYFLRLAIAERDKLEQAYRDAGSDVIPLLLIQFDDDRGGNGKNKEIVQVREQLDEMYRNNEDDTYAIWISNTGSGSDLRSDDAVIQNLDHNSVRILLFKQAVAMGWDCPRAQVLLRLRKVTDTSNVSFDLQTIGRIFRMPERHYYEDDELNYGYVYIPRDSYVLEKTVQIGLGGDSDSDTLKTERHTAPKTETKFPVPVPAHAAEDTSATAPAAQTKPAGTTHVGVFERTHSVIPEPIPTVPAMPVEDYIEQPVSPVQTHEKPAEIEVAEPTVITEIGRLNLAFKGQNQTIESTNPTADELYDEIEKLFNAEDTSTLKGLKHANELGTEEDYRSRELSISDSYINGATALEDMHETMHVNVSPKMREIEVNKKLGYLLRNKYTAVVREAFTDEAKVFFYKLTSGTDLKQRNDDQNILFLLNYSVVAKIESDLDNFNRAGVQREQGKNVDLQLPDEIYTREDGTDPSEKNLYGCISKSLSEPEKVFVKKLEASDDVSYWIKCPDKGQQALCVIYRTVEKERGRAVSYAHPTYPDFLVCFADGSIGIFETKDINDLEHQEENAAKEAAIKHRVSELNALHNVFIYKGALVYVDTKTEMLMDQYRNPLDVLN